MVLVTKQVMAAEDESEPVEGVLPPPHELEIVVLMSLSFTGIKQSYTWGHTGMWNRGHTMGVD